MNNFTISLLMDDNFQILDTIIKNWTTNIFKILDISVWINTDKVDISDKNSNIYTGIFKIHIKIQEFLHKILLKTH